ncbi:MAG: hypothetical protein V2A70_08345 [Candidatus Omnitrophota bacterium]
MIGQLKDATEDQVAVYNRRLFTQIVPKCPQKFPAKGFIMHGQYASLDKNGKGQIKEEVAVNIRDFGRRQLLVEHEYAFEEYGTLGHVESTILSEDLFVHGQTDVTIRKGDKIQINMPYGNRAYSRIIDKDTGVIKALIKDNQLAVVNGDLATFDETRTIELPFDGNRNKEHMVRVNATAQYRVTDKDLIYEGYVLAEDVARFTRGQYVDQNGRVWEDGLKKNQKGFIAAEQIFVKNINGTYFVPLDEKNEPTLAVRGMLEHYEIKLNDNGTISKADAEKIISTNDVLRKIQDALERRTKRNSAERDVVDEREIREMINSYLTIVTQGEVRLAELPKIFDQQDADGQRVATEVPRWAFELREDLKDGTNKPESRIAKAILNDMRDFGRSIVLDLGLERDQESAAQLNDGTKVAIDDLLEADPENGQIMVDMLLKNKLFNKNNKHIELDNSTAYQRTSKEDARKQTAMDQAIQALKEDGFKPTAKFIQVLRNAQGEILVASGVVMEFLTGITTGSSAGVLRHERVHGRTRQDDLSGNAGVATQARVHNNLKDTMIGGIVSGIYDQDFSVEEILAQTLEARHKQILYQYYMANRLYEKAGEAAGVSAEVYYRVSQLALKSAFTFQIALKVIEKNNFNLEKLPDGRLVAHMRVYGTYKNENGDEIPLDFQIRQPLPLENTARYKALVKEFNLNNPTTKELLMAVMTKSIRMNERRGENAANRAAWLKSTGIASGSAKGFEEWLRLSGDSVDWRSKWTGMKEQIVNKDGTNNLKFEQLDSNFNEGFSSESNVAVSNPEGFTPLIEEVTPQAPIPQPPLSVDGIREQQPVLPLPIRVLASDINDLNTAQSSEERANLAAKIFKQLDHAMQQGLITKDNASNPQMRALLMKAAMIPGVTELFRDNAQSENKAREVYQMASMPTGDEVRLMDQIADSAFRVDTVDPLEMGSGFDAAVALLKQHSALDELINGAGDEATLDGVGSSFRASSTAATKDSEGKPIINMGDKTWADYAMGKIDKTADPVLELFKYLLRGLTISFNELDPELAKLYTTRLKNKLTVEPAVTMYLEQVKLVPGMAQRGAIIKEIAVLALGADGAKEFLAKVAASGAAVNTENQMLVKHLPRAVAKMQGRFRHGQIDRAQFVAYLNKWEFALSGDNKVVYQNEAQMLKAAALKNLKDDAMATKIKVQKAIKRYYAAMDKAQTQADKDKAHTQFTNYMQLISANGADDEPQDKAQARNRAMYPETYDHDNAAKSLEAQQKEVEALKDIVNRHPEATIVPPPVVNDGVEKFQERPDGTISSQEGLDNEIIMTGDEAQVIDERKTYEATLPGSGILQGVGSIVDNVKDVANGNVQSGQIGSSLDIISNMKSHLLKVIKINGFRDDKTDMPRSDEKALPASPGSSGPVAPPSPNPNPAPKPTPGPLVETGPARTSESKTTDRS